jgi:hypothetical protein
MASRVYMLPCFAFVTERRGVFWGRTRTRLEEVFRSTCIDFEVELNSTAS